MAEGATHVGNSNRDRKAAFTLAEVLITLGIIGIVAAVVMPTVITKVQDHVFANQLLSNYSKITNVIERWQVDNDCLGNARGCLEMYKSQGAKMYYDPSVARDMFKDLVYKEYDLNNSSSEKFPKEFYGNSVNNAKYYNILAEEIKLSNPNAYFTCGSALYCAVLKTGATIQAYHHFQLPSDDPNDQNKPNHMYVSIVIDLNGYKSPNQYGRDRFFMSVGNGGYVWQEPLESAKNINPYRMYDTAIKIFEDKQCVLFNGIRYNACNPDDGCSPTAYVLKHRKLPSKELIKTNCSGS